MTSRSILRLCGMTPGRRRTSLMLVLFALGVLLTACGRGGEEPPATVSTQSVTAIPGVTFLPPIDKDKSKKPKGKPDQEVGVSIAIFNLVAGQAVGEPVGPNFSREDGTIKIAGNHFHANWKTSDSALPDGAKVRVELRLANTPENAPACNVQTGGVNADAGCIGFVDVQLWKNKGEVKKKGGDKDDILDLKNGQTLPIKFYIAPGAANTSPVVTITTPEDAATFKDDEAITLSATALDLEEGDLAEGLSWTSSLAGDLGTGPSITTAPLAIGTHVITAQVSDSAGRTGTASITVEVVQSAAPPTEPEVVGSTPTAFTGLGGLFSIVTVIEDVEGNPITDELELNNFSFSDISLSSVRTPDAPLTDGTAVATRLEVGGESGGPVSLAIMIDNSGSMWSNDRQSLRFDAAQQLIDQLSLPDEITVGSLNGVRQSLTTDYEKAKTVAGQRSGPSSDVYNGVIRAADELQKASNPNKAIVALTDGQTGLGNFETSVARANAVNAPVYTVGLGSNLQFDKLQEIAARTGGAFGEASRAEDLERVFNAIGRSITAGGIRVTGEVTLGTPLSQAGQYILSGNLITETRGETFSTPFSFRVFIDQGDLSVLPPKLTKATPDAGATVGGTEVTLTGDNFSRVNNVLFGNVPASSFSIESNLRLRAVAPAQNVETVEVTVASPEGQSNALSFTYETLPAIATVTPSKASTLGGETIVITGSDFTNVTGVSFNGAAATRFTVDSDTQITATVPATDKEGTVNLSVITAVGPSNAADFTYLAPPSLSAVSPDSALVEGGVTVMLTGADLSEVDTVTFGGVEATFTVNSDTRITATVPAGSEGSTKLNVRSSYGQSNALDFTYTTIPAPILDTLSPREGASAGGTSVVLTGENLANVTSVSFGGKTANFTQNSDTQITVNSPAGTGSVDVKVTTAGGTSNALSFGYIEPPVLTSISPSEGPVAGGTVVTVVGQNLTQVTKVRFGDTSVRFTVDSDTRITTTSPPAAEGSTSLSVSSLGGNADQAFNYIRPPNNSPVVESFTVSDNSIDVGEEVIFNWLVSDADNDSVSCTLDLGISTILGYSANLKPIEIDDCVNRALLPMQYPEQGTYTAVLTARDAKGDVTTASTTLRVSTPSTSIEVIPFSDTRAQEAWNLISNSYKLRRLNLSFNFDGATAFSIDTSGIAVIVPELEQGSQFSHVTGIVLDNEIMFLTRQEYSKTHDTLHIRNVLMDRSVAIEGYSRYGESLSDSEFQELQGKIESLYRDPVFDYFNSGVQKQSLAFNALTCSMDDVRLVSNSRSVSDCDEEYAGWMAFSTFWVSQAAVGYHFQLVAVGLACGTGVGCLPALTGFGLRTLPSLFLAVKLWTDTYTGYRDCLRSVGVSSGTNVIALITPPLPFSQQVFVESIPEGIKVGSGYLSSDPSPDEVRAILEPAIANSEFIFELYASTQVISDATQIDVGMGEITTVYIGGVTGFASSFGCRM